MGAGNRVGMGLSYRPASPCSLASLYDNLIPTWFLGPIDCSKIPALEVDTTAHVHQYQYFPSEVIPTNSCLIFFYLRPCHYEIVKTPYELATLNLKSVVTICEKCVLLNSRLGPRLFNQ
jgi:hypothetical protein